MYSLRLLSFFRANRIGVSARLLDSRINLLARFFFKNSFKVTSFLSDKKYIGLYKGSFLDSRLIARSILRFRASFLALAFKKTLR
jgi:hypothetical protein